MRIAVYTITKNEEQFIGRWAESCADADYRLIVDTGSTDNTIATAEVNGCTVASITVSPWRFDDARNAALALLPDDIDYCIALDADEILVKGWREHLEKVDLSVTRPRYKYVWSWNIDGSEGLVYSGDKIHSRKNYRWKHPVHEVAICTGEEVQGWCGLEIHHHPDNSKSRSQYLPLLRQAVAENPNDDRNQFYLGRELMFHGLNEEAVIHLTKHLELSQWKAERATCMRYLGRVTGNKEHWLLRACAESPDRREPWLELANHYHGQKRWLPALSASHNALGIKEKPLEYLCEAEAWGPLLHDIAGICAWNIGLRDLACHHYIEAFLSMPSDNRLRGNCAVILAMTASTPVEVIIPTRSNFSGLDATLNSLKDNETISKIHIVADGREAYEHIAGMSLPAKTTLYRVDNRPGIHRMWNLALASVKDGSHVLFLNDDTIVHERSVDTMSGLLDREANVGLICPNYDSRKLTTVLADSSETCRGRYDGTGGIAGFCMMLRNSLAKGWKFDEQMKWWYGDDDLVNWVAKSTNHRTAITALATCSGNKSWTVENDTPDNFVADTNNDRIIFEQKWGN